jgi:hypothetical protein
MAPRRLGNQPREVEVPGVGERQRHACVDRLDRQHAPEPIAQVGIVLKVESVPGLERGRGERRVVIIDGGRALLADAQVLAAVQVSRRGRDRCRTGPSLEVSSEPSGSSELSSYVEYRPPVTYFIMKDSCSAAVVRPALRRRKKSFFRSLLACTSGVGSLVRVKE